MHRPGLAGTLDASKVRETLFPNGLRLVVKEARATDLAAVQLWVRAGSFLEDEKNAGTAHVIEHLLFRAGDEPSAAGVSIDAEVENLGGLMEAATQKDWTQLSCTVSGRYVGKVVQVIAEALRKPQFTPAALEAEKPILTEELNQIRFNPEAVVSVALYELAFKTHPYRHDVRGTPRMISQVDLKLLRAYYERHYIPANMTLVVVGDVDAAGVERATRAAFQADQPGPKREPLKLPPPERACATAERKVLQSPFGTGFVGLGYPAPSVADDPEVYVMDVLLTLLENGDAGRLPLLLRSTGAVAATYETRRQAGLFTVIAGTNGSVEQLEAMLRKELDFIAERPLPAAELQMAKSGLRGTYALDSEPYSGQASMLGYYAAIDRWQFASEYLAKVEAVTADQVQALAKKYLDPQHCVTVVLKPRAGAPAPPRSAT